MHKKFVMMPEAPADNQGSSRVAAFLRGHSLGDFVDALAKGAASQKRPRPEKLVALAGTLSVGDGLKVGADANYLAPLYKAELQTYSFQPGLSIHMMTVHGLLSAQAQAQLVSLSLFCN